MSDTIAESAANLGDAASNSTEPQPVVPEVAQVGEQSSSLSSGAVGSAEAGNADASTSLAGAATDATTGNVLLNAAPVISAPSLAGDTKTLTNVENDLNPLVPAAGTEGPPTSQLEAAQAEPEAEPLPRDAHLSLLASKLAAMRLKLINAERIAIDEFEQIVDHISAVI